MHRARLLRRFQVDMSTRKGEIVFITFLIFRKKIQFKGVYTLLEKRNISDSSAVILGKVTD